MAAPRSMSPGGALLRASRLFSLPSPIPAPPTDLSDGVHFASDSATRAFPTHQVITTPKSSRKRGDWGLKRPFPLKSTTKTSTPMITVKQVDSIEHISDFNSGSNYGLTLRKFQELNLPVTMPNTDKGSTIATPRSVFEEDGDFIAINPGKERMVQDKRWNFRGPWLAGMSPGEFQRWLLKRIKHRRPEFQLFLKKKLAVKLVEDVQAKATDDGGLDFEPVEPIDPNTITEEQLTKFLCTLRANRQQLYDLVSEFLDLAPLQPPDVAESLGSLVNYGAVNLKLSESPYAEKGPPIAHPSGGISYLRTAAHLDNHPVYGPQANHPPVEGRIIAPRASNGFAQSTIGVAGFVPNIYGDQGLSSRDAKDDNLRRFNPDVPGGAKVFVQPTSARIDSRGRMVLNVKKADLEDECIAKELQGRDKVFGQSRNFNDALSPARNQLRHPVGNLAYNRYISIKPKV